MKIVLASGNKGKVKEIEALLPEYEIIPYKKLLGDFEVEEDGLTFKENAIKKAKAIYDAIDDTSIVVISDDSGLSVPLINNEPGVYSARYAGVNAKDNDNNQKLIDKLNDLNITKTPAFYTACICMVYKNQIYTTHGWMYGDIINKQIGNGGFGYDPMFIPKGLNDTLGVIDTQTKKEFSHRTNALKLMEKYMKVLFDTRGY
jgi:XTP/dITP diphosphohydrolase